jgi:hypothetical protein
VVLQRPGQVIALEPGDPGPQPDISGRGVLRLQPTDLLDRLDDRSLRALEQQLAG